MPRCFAQAIQFLKCAGVDLIAVHLFAAEFAVASVEVQAMFARDEREGLLQVGAQFIRRPRLAGVIAGGDESAAQRPADIFKAADVIALPAMDRNCDPGKRFKRGCGIHSQRQVAFAGENVGALEVTGGSFHKSSSRRHPN